MKKVLIIWEEVGCATYLVELLLEKKDFDEVVRFHGHYINGTEDESLEKEMLAFFYDEDGNFRFPRSKDAMFGKEFDAVILTGFYV